MRLPHKFRETLEKFDQHGILEEDLHLIQDRLLNAVHGVADQGSGNTRELSRKLLNDIKDAIREEVCEPHGDGIKKQYHHLLQKSLNVEGIEAAAFVAAKVVASLDPLFAVSSIITYISIWIIKSDLSSWCRKSAA